MKTITKTEIKKQQLAREEALAEKITSTTPIYELGSLALRFWKPMYFGAVPYAEAMTALSSDTDKYGCDDARSIVTYFLCNAGTWRGPLAKAVKQSIKTRFGMK